MLVTSKAQLQQPVAYRFCLAPLLCQKERKGKGSFTLLSMIQEDQLNDGWSPAISDFDQVTNLKAL